MKKRIATFLSASIVLSAMMMPSGTVFADDFSDDTEVIFDEEFFDEEETEDDILFETELNETAAGFTEETEEKESETETETNEKDEMYVKDSGTCGKNLTWKYKDGVLTITGYGALELDEYNLAPWYYTDEVKEVILPEGLTSIPDHTFGGYSNLTSIHIPDSVTDIGVGAFNCSGLKSVVIGNGIKKISRNAFFGCQNLESVTLNNQVISIETSAFKKCISLKNINLPDSLQYIKKEAFAYCSSLSEVIIPDHVQYIGSEAYSQCTSLKRLVIGNGVKAIGPYAFYADESGLYDVTIPANVTYIGYGAFYFSDWRVRYDEYDNETINPDYIPNGRHFTFEGKHVQIDDISLYAFNNAYFTCQDNSDALAYAKKYNYPYQIINPSADKIEPFVKRLYTTCLNRNPDTNGLNYWKNQLVSGKSTGAVAAGGFIFSNESIKKNLCQSCFIDQLYRCFLGRNADKGGKQYWLDQMKHGASRAEVFGGFVVSNEFSRLCLDYGIDPGEGVWTKDTGIIEGDCKNCGAKNKTVLDFIERMYKTCLGRGSDTTGRNYWLGEIKKGKTGEQVALGFLTSNEIKAKKLSDEDFVEICYRAFFGRAGDANGKAYWVNKLKKGESRESIVSGFADSTEFKKLCNEYGIKRSADDKSQLPGNNTSHTHKFTGGSCISPARCSCGATGNYSDHQFEETKTYIHDDGVAYMVCQGCGYDTENGEDMSMHSVWTSDGGCWVSEYGPLTISTYTCKTCGITYE